MARGAVRGAVVAWLGLITLHGLTTKNGSKAVGGAFDVVGNVVERALSPNVAAIPDRREGGGTPIEQNPTTGAVSRPRPNSDYDMGPINNRIPIPGHAVPQ